MESIVEPLIALVALTAMEIVLGIDNIVFIAILSGRLPKEQQAKGRTLGLAAAMGMRILLLCTLNWVIGMTEPMFALSDLGIPASWLAVEVNEISLRDLIMFVGGLFLVGKSVHEIHDKLEGPGHHRDVSGTATFASVLMQIAVLDIIFSLDSVITAVGMAEDLWVMITAIILAVGVMMVFAGTVSAFVERHPTLKMLALSFLILIGVMLIAEGVGTGVNKGYIYFAMAFSLMVEFLNLKMRSKRRAAAPVDTTPE